MRRVVSSTKHIQVGAQGTLTLDGVLIVKNGVLTEEGRKAGFKYEDN